MSNMNINYFLASVEHEAIKYPNVSQNNIDLFSESVLNILADSIASTDGCIYDLGNGDDVELTAENLSLAIQNGESIEHFAGRVCVGTMNFDTLTVTYDDLVATHVRLSQNNNHIILDFNPNGDIHFHSPLDFGPRSAVDKAIRDCREDFIKFIIKELGKAERFKNMIIDEDNILKQFGIGYGSVKKYGDGFKAQDVVDCFKGLYDTDNIEQVIYNQILTTAKRTLKWHFCDTTTEIKRFGKDNSGIILHYYNGYNGTNKSPTTELIKLLFIKYEGVSSLSAKTFDIDAGDTLSSSDLPFCENLKTFKNGNLKIKFPTKERADEVCNLLLGD